MVLIVVTEGGDRRIRRVVTAAAGLIGIPACFGAGRRLCRVVLIVVTECGEGRFGKQLAAQIADQPVIARCGAGRIQTLVIGVPVVAGLLTRRRKLLLPRRAAAQAGVGLDAGRSCRRLDCHDALVPQVSERRERRFREQFAAVAADHLVIACRRAGGIEMLCAGVFMHTGLRGDRLGLRFAAACAGVGHNARLRHRRRQRHDTVVPQVSERISLVSDVGVAANLTGIGGVAAGRTGRLRNGLGEFVLALLRDQHDLVAVAHTQAAGGNVAACLRVHEAQTDCTDDRALRAEVCKVVAARRAGIDIAVNEDRGNAAAVLEAELRDRAALIEHFGDNALRLDELTAAFGIVHRVGALQALRSKDVQILAVENR